MRGTNHAELKRKLKSILAASENADSSGAPSARSAPKGAKRNASRTAEDGRDAFYDVYGADVRTL
jgi:hypothetical protein